MANIDTLAQRIMTVYWTMQEQGRTNDCNRICAAWDKWYYVSRHYAYTGCTSPVEVRMDADHDTMLTTAAQEQEAELRQLEEPDGWEQGERMDYMRDYAANIDPYGYGDR